MGKELVEIKVHGLVRDKLIELYALLELDSIIVVRDEDKQEMRAFIDKIPKIIEML